MKEIRIFFTCNWNENILYWVYVQGNRYGKLPYLYRQVAGKSTTMRQVAAKGGKEMATIKLYEGCVLTNGNEFVEIASVSGETEISVILTNGNTIKFRQGEPSAWFPLSNTIYAYSMFNSCRDRNKPLSYEEREIVRQFGYNVSSVAEFIEATESILAEHPTTGYSVNEYVLCDRRLHNALRGGVNPPEEPAPVEWIFQQK